MARTEVLAELAALIMARRPAHPLRVAIDGIDAAGKTTLAGELAPLVERAGRPVIRAGSDGFHRPRADRYRQGALSPAGYYDDSFDTDALLAALLIPLGPRGTRRYRRAVFDYRQDERVAAPEERAPRDAVLLFDGVFLLRPELAAHWDFRILVAVTAATALRRAQERDKALFGDAGAVTARYRQRYLPGQRLYFAAVHPQAAADVIVVNDDPVHPYLARPGSGVDLAPYSP